jgi:hypothetical protein
MSMIKGTTQAEAEAIARWLAQGNKPQVLRPSLAPVCIPVPRGAKVWAPGRNPLGDTLAHTLAHPPIAR